MDSSSKADAWARFRFSVIGPLLSSPLKRGELNGALSELADKTWVHPTDGRPVKFAMPTIERWTYKARSNPDPFGVLRRAVRKDIGTITLNETLAKRIHTQYHAHTKWSYQPNWDNLEAAVKQKPVLSRGELRKALGVKNERLREVLERLEAEGELIRQSRGWQLP